MSPVTCVTQWWFANIVQDTTIHRYAQFFLLQKSYWFSFCGGWPRQTEFHLQVWVTTVSEVDANGRNTLISRTYGAPFTIPSCCVHFGNRQIASVVQVAIQVALSQVTLDSHYVDLELTRIYNNSSWRRTTTNLWHLRWRGEEQPTRATEEPRIGDITLFHP